MSESSLLQTVEAENRSNISSSEALTASGSSDPASSLRAAALLTLKSKRRKPQNEQLQALPSRPPPPSDAVHLDYGQEDISSSPPAVTAEIPSLPLKPPSTQSAQDDQMREEGEISDEEDIQTPINPPPIPGSPKPAPHPPLATKPESSVQPPSVMPPAPEQVSPAPRLSDRISDSSYIEDTSMLVDQQAVVEDLPLHLIDADHVRPGLALNQFQYDTAKDILLDLLGWGVAPEYLVDCGLTREIVFYVFSELNLRLPQNLDLTGLLPYTPEIKSLVDQHQPPFIPHPSHPPARISQGHPSLPSRPHLSEYPPSPAVTTSPARSAAKDVANAPQTPNSSNLHDIEQQRRQELLARKAVIASRKSKMSNGPHGNSEPTPLEPTESHINGNDVEMTVPTETVDDFLKSIGPNPESILTVGQSKPADGYAQQRQTNGDDMDVDEIPGLASSRSYQHYSNNEQTSLSLAERHLIISPTLSVANSTSQFEYPPSSAESTKTTFNVQYPPTDASFSEIQRRGAKRPVASDFVDFETAPRSHSRSNGSTGHYPSRNAPGNGFASVGGMRRCIIDLSDSEGEDGEDVVMRDGNGNSKDKSGRRNSYVSPAPIRPTITNLASNRWTPSPVVPSLSTTIPASSGTMSPAGLMEKEIEIRKMRELIAQREQNRLKKATSVRSSGTNTPDTTPPGHLAFPPATAETTTSAGQEQPTHPLRESVSPQISGLDPSVPIEESSRLASPSSSGTATIDTLNGSPTIVNNSSTGEPVLTAEGRHEQAVNSFTETHSGNESPTSGLVDVDPASSSSAQISPTITSARPRLDASQDLSLASPPTPPPIRHSEDYTAYDSPFQWYPGLGSRSQLLLPDGAQGSPLSSSLSFSSTSTSSLSFISDSSSFTMPSSSSSVSSFYSSPAHRISTIPTPNLKPFKLAMTVKQLDPFKRICQFEVPGGGVCRDEGCDDVHLSRISLLESGLEPSDQDTSDYLVNTLPSAWLDEHGVSQSKISSALLQIRLKNPLIPFEERVAQALATLGPPALPAPTPK